MMNFDKESGKPIVKLADLGMARYGAGHGVVARASAHPNKKKSRRTAPKQGAGYEITPTMKFR